MKGVKKYLSIICILSCFSFLFSCKEESEDSELIKIGILSQDTHQALKNTANGFINALSDSSFKDGENIEVIYKDAEGSSSSLKKMSYDLVSDCDLLLGLGTDATLNLKSSLSEQLKDTPLLFSAVTSPVDAGIISSMENHKENITGTSDESPIDAQISLIDECFKTLDSYIDVGILYSSFELNSVNQKEIVVEKAKSLSMNVYLAPISGEEEILSKLNEMIDECETKLDALYIPTDNTIAANMQTVKEIVDKNSILCVCGEESMTKEGGHITYSIDYTKLGYRTGEMATSILNGEKEAKDIDCETMNETSYLKKVYSSKNLKDANIEIDSSLLQGFEDISEE